MNRFGKFNNIVHGSFKKVKVYNVALMDGSTFIYQNKIYFEDVGTFFVFFYLTSVDHPKTVNIKSRKRKMTQLQGLT